MQDKHLTHIIAKHDKALKNYTPCDKYWLILEEGSFAADSFNRIEVSTPVESSFDKVFVYRKSKGEAVCLK